MKKPTTLFTIILVILGSFSAQAKRFNINKDKLFPSTLKSSQFAHNFDIAVKQARPFFINPAVKSFDNVSTGDTILLELFSGKEYLSVIQSKSVDVNGVAVLRTKLIDFDFAFGFISISNEKVLITIDIPELKEKYSTRFRKNDDTLYLIQLDERNLDELKDATISREETGSLKYSQLSEATKKSNSSNSILKSAQQNLSLDDTVRIDLLIVYTPAAKKWSDANEGGIDNTISQAVAKCNLVSENSQLGINFNLVHTNMVDYEESGDLSTDISNLTDGVISNVQDIRDIAEADLVVLLAVNNNLGGMAWLLSDRNGLEDFGYSVIRVQQASGLTTMHEIGHNLGANHPKEQTFEPGPTIWSNWPENSWSAGWRWQSEDDNYYCTIMGYDAGWYYPDGNSTIQVPYFSDPNINLLGTAIGDKTYGNNALTIRETKHLLTDYKTNEIHQTPVLYSLLVDEHSKDSIFSGGNIIKEGDSPVIARGIVWGNKPLPTLNDDYTSDGIGVGAFQSKLANLTLDSVYYVRAYATNDYGTSYGNQVGLIYNGGIERDFITIWQLPEGQDKLEFALQTKGDLSYKWETIPEIEKGFGTIQKVYGVVEINNLPAGKKIRLSIEAKNLERFFTNQVCNPAVDTNDEDKLLDVVQWGTAQWTSMRNAFEQCQNLNVSATDIPNLFKVLDMQYLFCSCKNLVGPENMNDWYVGNVRIMSDMFCLANSFNQNIGAWNVSKVKLMNGMFQEAKNFNQDIGNWNVSNVTRMDQMFNAASAFNEDIGDWDLSKVTNMATMFGGAKSFNHDIGKWDVSKVTDMFSMFSDAAEFNHDIGAWNVSNVKNMCQMFDGAGSFNQDISKWDVSVVEDMGAMFRNAHVFNQNIGNWNVSKVKNMERMFHASNFNKYIGNWEVSNVKNMEGMFYAAKNFNQKISNWEVSNSENMENMFYKASAFNQNIGNWNISNVVSIEHMLDYSGLGLEHYSSTLIGWSENVNIPENLKLGAAGRKYNHSAFEARNKLITNKKWVITGDEMISANESFVINSGSSNCTVYPNPVFNTLNISAENISTPLEFQIINGLGEIILKGNFVEITTISANNLHPGIYFVKIGNEGVFEFRKLIKN